MKWKAAILILSFMFLCGASLSGSYKELEGEPRNDNERGIIGPRTFISRCLRIKLKCKFSCTKRICKRCMKCPDEDRPPKLPKWNIPPSSAEDQRIKEKIKEIILPYPVPVPQPPDPFPVPYPVPYPAPYPSNSCNKCSDEPQSCNKCGGSNPYPYPYPYPAPNACNNCGGSNPYPYPAPNAVDGPCNSCG